MLPFLSNIGRLSQIVRVIAKYGFEDIISNTPLIRFLPEKNYYPLDRETNVVNLENKISRWERVRMIAEELGPTFIKLAQVLSNRPDILPDELITEFQKLQSNVPPFPTEQAKKIIELETGKKMDELFDFFEDKPVGSASIGQVHKARLKDGREVVVKIRRPAISKTIMKDISIMKELVKMTERNLEKNGITNAMDVIIAFEKTMQKELDYLTEARNIKQFRAVYKNEKAFYVPDVFKEISTSRVLFIEFVDGCKITDKVQILEWNLSPEKIVERGLDIYLSQIFKHGFFHADPHPGNILIRKDGAICLIDFGMVGRLSQRDKMAFAGVMTSMAQQDARGMAQSLKSLALNYEVTDNRTLESDLQELIDDFTSLEISESSMAEMAVRLQKIIYEYKMRIPGSVFLILRALAILEGIGKIMHPNFNSYDYIKPYAFVLLKERLNPSYLLQEGWFRFNRLDDFFRALPNDISEILKKVKKGKLQIQVEHIGYEQPLNTLNRIANKIALSILVVGSLVASTLIAMVPVPGPFMTGLGLNIFSLIGFGIASMFGLILVINIFRKQ